MMIAYQRNPRLLFRPLDLRARWDAPMQGTIRYGEVELLVDLHADLCRGCIVHEAAVDWHTGAIALFESQDDVLCDVPSYTVYAAFQEGTPLPPERYAEEIERYLLRGHSLLDPACECKHQLSEERCLELGVTADAERSGFCTCPKAVLARTEAEICRELAVLHLPPLQGGVLEQQQTDKKIRLARFCSTSIRSLEELRCGMHEIARHRGVVITKETEVYPCIEYDIKRLVSLGEIYRIDACHLYPRQGSCCCRVDPEIQALWDSSGGGDRGERALLACGLQPARQANPYCCAYAPCCSDPASSQKRLYPARAPPAPPRAGGARTASAARSAAGARRARRAAAPPRSAGRCGTPGA
jgi:hypothetical protein